MTAATKVGQMASYLVDGMVEISVACLVGKRDGQTVVCLDEQTVAVTDCLLGLRWAVQLDEKLVDYSAAKLD